MSDDGQPFHGHGSISRAEKEDIWEHLGVSVGVFLLVYVSCLLAAYVFDRYLSNTYAAQRRARRERQKKEETADREAEATTTPNRTTTRAVRASWEQQRAVMLGEASGCTWANVSRQVHDTARTLKTAMEPLEVAVDLTILVIFCVRTYREEQVAMAVEAVACAFFVFHFLVRLIDTSGSLRFLMQFRNAMDLLSMVASLYAVAHDQWLSLVFLRTVQMRFAIHSMSVGRSSSELAKEVQLFVADTILLLFTFSCAIFCVEYLGAVPGYDTRSPTEWNAFSSFYFTFITITTVGYGEFVPKTVFGRWLCIVFIIWGLVLFSDKTTSIFRAAAAARRGLGRFHNRAGDPHVVICGRPNLALLRDLLHELYHPERLLVSEQAFRRQVVVLVDRQPWLDDFEYLVSTNSIYRGRVRVLIGSALNDDDLDRVRCADAEGVFVVNAPTTLADVRSEDDLTLLRGLSIRQYITNENTARELNPKKSRFWSLRPELPNLDLPIFMLFHSTQAKARLQSAQANFEADTGLEAFAFRDELRMGFFALSCMAPGLSTVFFNLVKSRGSEFHERLEQRDWQFEYLFGASMELYIQELRGTWTETDDFVEVAERMYRTFSIILLGYIHPQTGNVELNPHGTIPTGALGILIAESDEQAATVAQALTLQEEAHKRRASTWRRAAAAATRNLSASSHKTELELLSLDDREAAGYGPDPIPISAHDGADDDGDDEEAKLVTDALSETSSAAHAPVSRRQHSFLARMSFSGAVMPSKELPVPSAAACSNHIIVVSLDGHGLEHFIAPIRKREALLRHQKSLKSSSRAAHGVAAQSIMIVCPEACHWCLPHGQHTFQDVYFYQSQIHERTMARLHFEKAARIVVLGTNGSVGADFTSDDTGALGSTADLSDSEVVFAVLRIRHYLEAFIFPNPDARPFIVCDVANSSSIKYLSQNLPRYSSLHDCPSFAAGEVIPGSISHLVLMQTFYNPCFLSVLNTLVTQSTNEVGAHVFQLPLSNRLAKFAHGTFGELFRTLLLDERMICIGLLRHNNHESCPPGPHGACRGQTAPKRYVFTSPPADVVLCPYDRVFVISQGTDPSRKTDDDGRSDSEEDGHGTAGAPVEVDLPVMNDDDDDDDKEQEVNK